MITAHITNELKNTLNGFDEHKMYSHMLKHYKLLNVVDDSGKWATSELEEISSELLPSDITEEKSKSFIDEVALLAENNPYFVNFLEKAKNINFQQLDFKVREEGGQLFPDVIAYSMVLDRLTKATYSNPKILENCVKIFKKARKRSHAYKYMSLFHKIKLVSIEYAIKIYLSYHKTLMIPVNSGRLGLTVNILEAVVSDYISGFRNNAKTGLILAVHRTGSKNHHPLTGSGPSTWTEDKKAVSMSMPMTKEWCDLYQTWNMAFVSTFKDFPYIIPKLFIPQVANYQDAPKAYMYKRILALFLCLNHASFNYAEKIKSNKTLIQWNDRKLSDLWGKINLENAKNYNQILSSRMNDL